MKKCFCAFVLLCFCVSACVYHEVSPPEPEVKKSPPTKPKTLKNKIIDYFASSKPYLFKDASIPVTVIWRNTNSKSYDYINFFNSVCPVNYQKNSDNELTCDLSLDNLVRKFKIKKEGNKIFIKFDELGWKTDYVVTSFEAEWEIIITPNGFSVKKYEISTKEYVKYYKIITIRVNTQPKFTISAEGIISSSMGIYDLGTYDFYFENLYYGECKNKPVGMINLSNGVETAKILFYEDVGCEPYAYIEINNQPGAYKLTTKNGWLLQDLFDPLKYFIKPLN